jgi:pimeloyl-ACP methyl ester carboxylesterase
MERVSVGEVELAYEALGDPADPPLLLVMGLGAQLHYWPDGFCDALVRQGLFVVRYDNRDVGESSHLPGVRYTLSDLAADAVGLIAALGHPSAHFAGVSLGGMIVQQAAIEHPARVRSLTSISSTTGDPAVGAPAPHALAALLAPPPRTREAVGEAAVKLAQVIGSPGFERDEAWLRRRSMHAFDRAFDPEGSQRQFGAVMTASDRTARLRELEVPALVVHGSADPLVDVSGGRATAAAIPGAELLIIDGMGHDLPPGVWTRLADAIARTVQRGEGG